MLSLPDFKTDTIYVSKNNNGNILIVKVTSNIQPEHKELVSKWKTFIFDKDNVSYVKDTQHIFIVYTYHMLSNKLNKGFDKRFPFIINVESTSSSVYLRDYLRKHIRVLSKDKELIILQKDVSEDLSGLINYKEHNVNIINKDSSINNIKYDPLSLVLATSYSYLNKSNNFITLMNN